MAPAVMPVQQLTLLALCSLVDPIAITSVLPYLPEMIESFGVPQDDVAIWAGVVTSVYSASQCLAAMPWGALSNFVGRRPAVLISLFISVIATLVWGFATSLPMAIFGRLLAGTGNGVLGVYRTMIAEMCPWKELQPVAFSVMPLAWTIGSVFGPAISGALAHKSPEVPPEHPTFLDRFPYALPNIFAACIILLVIAATTLFLKETLPGSEDKKDIGLQIGEFISSKLQSLSIRLEPYSLRATDMETASLLGNPIETTFGTADPVDECGEETTIKDEEHESVFGWRDVMTTQARLNVAVYSMMCLHATSYDQLLPVYMNRNVQDLNGPDVSLPFKFSGGFGFKTSQISVLYTTYGIATILIQVFIFPPCAKKFGLLKCFKGCSIGFIVSYFLTPLASLFPTTTGKLAAFISIWMIKAISLTIAYPTSTILLANSVDNTRHLATLNGLTTVTSCIGRVIGPLILGPVFKYGVDQGYIILPFWTLAAVTAVAAIPVFYLRDLEIVRDQDAV